MLSSYPPSPLSSAALVPPTNQLSVTLPREGKQSRLYALNRVTTNIYIFSTTGGIGGSTVTVTSLAALTSAVAGDQAKIVYVSGAISGNTIVKVGSNTSILGKSGASLVGVGIRISKKNNVIVRNLKISKVLASVGDALGIQEASKVWVDHIDLSSDRDHDKDYYDGLLDITHGSTFVSITNSYLHDHFKGSLVGHSDSNEAEDKKITVTYALNKFSNLNSRMPSFRFGTGHLFNN